MIIYSNGFIINPTKEVAPTIRISPYIDLPDFEKGPSHITEEYFSSRFLNYAIYFKARDAIVDILRKLRLQPNDEVSILTTTGNFYISSCVTNAIEKVCKWNREINANTKAIFVNHEFGYAYENLSSLKKYDLPIIEDCAHSFVSQNSEQSVGKIGDFVIYSLPKFFPIQIGGLVVSNHGSLCISDKIPSDVKQYIYSTISPCINKIDDICRKRIANYNYFKDCLRPIGIIPFGRPLNNITVPGVFMFSWEDIVNYDHLKEYMQNNGVESSVFYHKKVFFIPVHHNLSEGNKGLIVELLKNYKNDIC